MLLLRVFSFVVVDFVVLHCATNQPHNHPYACGGVEEEPKISKNV
jgi:hypothetical protein